MVISASSPKVKVAETVTLTCRVTGSSSQEKIRWFKRSEEMHEDGEKYTFEYIYTVDQNSGVTFNFISHLEISKFGLADDMGLYKCGNLEHYSSSISLDLLGEY